MRFLKAQLGFSMVQGMVISAVLAGSALMATRMMSTQKMSQRSAETKDQIGELHKQIFATLQNREHCLTTFSTPLATVAANSTYPVPEIKTKPESTGTGHAQFRVNSGSATGDMYMNGNVRINSMNLRTTADLSQPQPLVINYMRLEGKTATGVRSGMGFGGKSISKTINIRLQRASAASTTINGCYAVETNAESQTGTGNSDLNKDFCEKLGTGFGETQSLFTWDETRNTCVLKDTVCPDKTVFEGVNSTGLPICRPFEDYVPYFLAPGLNPCASDKGEVRLAYDTGTNKVSIVCSGTTGPSCNPLMGNACTKQVVSSYTCSGSCPPGLNPGYGGGGLNCYTGAGYRYGLCNTIPCPDTPGSSADTCSSDVPGTIDCSGNCI